ncbi:MAG: FAD-binding oxidoreductase [Solirubrobacterales bacterium]|nr:FAD-binding oxidoreductase [Solirubrobacterales bacterium]
MATVTTHAPATFEEAAEALAGAAAEGRRVRIVGAGSKLHWGNPTDAASADLELRTTALNEIVEHNAGDLTATLQAGVSLADAQRTFAEVGQTLALDPPLVAIGSYPPPTIGGVVATGDSGPLRHRYGAPRDLVIGATVALSDGTIASSGGKVIKNVAGYDLAKLFSGSFGTLGLILSVSVRLHPLHDPSATAVGATDHVHTLARAAVALAAFPAELEALDIAWHGGRGGILARCGGREASRRAQRTAERMLELDLEGVDVAEPDEPLWERQRAGQRSPDEALLRVSVPPAQLAAVLLAADAADATVVGRAALGTSYLTLAPKAVADVRRRLPQGATSVVLDAPPGVELDRWGPVGEPALRLMRRVKQRFDPAGICNPGVFVGGI